MTRRSLFRLSGMALLGAVAAPLASLVPKPKSRRFIASVVIVPTPAPDDLRWIAHNGGMVQPVVRS